MTGEKPENTESDDEEDDEDEEDADAMEPDLDKNEILKHQAGELVGDRLLYTKYCGSTSAHQRKKRVSAKYSGARTIHTKIREKVVRIKQNVRIIHTSKSLESMGKLTIVRITIVKIKQNVRIIKGSHYAASTVHVINILRSLALYRTQFTCYC